MLRSAILAAARNERIEKVVTHAPGLPLGRAPLRRRRRHRRRGRRHPRLIGAGLTVTLDHLGEDTTDRAQADAVVDAYLELLRRARSGAASPSGSAR